uniref:Uncharacterized protein n=1 Tax=Tetranychus urticae TaxID=32264 RepID=T1JYZ6_TETUR
MLTHSQQYNSKSTTTTASINGFICSSKNRI